MIYCQGMQSVWFSRVCLINDVICGCWFLNIFSPWSAMGWACWTVSCYQGYCCFFLSFLELLLHYYCCFSSNAQVFRSVISSLWISPFSISSVYAFILNSALSDIESMAATSFCLCLSDLPLNEYPSIFNFAEQLGLLCLLSIAWVDFALWTNLKIFLIDQLRPFTSGMAHIWSYFWNIIIY